MDLNRGQIVGVGKWAFGDESGWVVPLPQGKGPTQGSHKSWNPEKVLEFEMKNSRPTKVLEF